MEGQFFAEYLGSSTLPKGATGLGLIQKPLKEYYISYQKSPRPNNVKNVTIRISPQGIVFIFPGDNSGQSKELSFGMASIIYIEAVKFIVSKETEKKIHCGFLPMDESRLPAKGREKLFSLLDKKLNFLAEMDHPPLLTCVMRRTSGIKALDCHVFVVESANDACRISSYVESVQRHQMEPIDNGISRNDSYKYAIPNDFPDTAQSREVKRDNYYKDKSDRYSDGSGHYLGPEPVGGCYGNEHENDRWNKNSGSEKGAHNEPIISSDGNYGLYDRNRISEHSDRMPLRNDGYGSRNEYLDNIRPRSPHDQQFNVFSDKIERRDHYTNRNVQAENISGYGRRSGDMRSPRSPELRHKRVVSPLRDARPPVESQRSPKPQDTIDEPVYSASNMENRKVLETKVKARNNEHRGIAKLPAHVMAGVKVLPSLVPVMLKKTHSPPPVKKVEMDVVRDERYEDDDDPYDNYVPREGYYYFDDSGHKQILTGGGWKTDKDNPYGHGGDVPPDVLPRHEEMHQYAMQRDQNQYGNRIQDSNEDRAGHIYSGKNRQELNVEQAQHWPHKDQLQRHAQNRDRYNDKNQNSLTETGCVSRENFPQFGGNGYREQDKLPKGNDAEIESMFSYLNVDHNRSDNA